MTRIKRTVEDILMYYCNEERRNLSGEIGKSLTIKEFETQEKEVQDYYYGKKLHIFERIDVQHIIESEAIKEAIEAKYSREK